MAKKNFKLKKLWRKKCWYRKEFLRWEEKKYAKINECPEIYFDLSVCLSVHICFSLVRLLSHSKKYFVPTNISSQQIFRPNKYFVQEIFHQRNISSKKYFNISSKNIFMLQAVKVFNSCLVRCSPTATPACTLGGAGAAGIFGCGRGWTLLWSYVGRLWTR